MTYMASKGLIWFALAIIYCFAQPSLCSTSSCSQNLPSCQFGEKNETWCCPYKNGVCCNDSLRICCPEGTICIADIGLCMPLNYMGLLMTKTLYSPVPLFSQDLKNRPKIEVCPSKTMICPSKSTCCPAPYIGYDCCPLVHGNCCGDFKHCCPFNTTCDINKGMCVDAHQNKFPWMKKTKAEAADFTHVKKIKLFKTFVRSCPDRETRCEHHHTCCPSSNGKYECCSFANGVCCPDASHCCPAGTVCDNSTSECLQATVNKKPSTVAKLLPKETNVELTSSTRYQLKPLLVANLTLICPGGQYSCPDYMTCCPTAGHRFGCCQFPNAVCCSDNWHCCPGGSQCDVEHDKCIRDGKSTPLFEKTAPAKVTTKVAPSLSLQNQLCPDQSQCPDNYTCCQMLTSGYGCCPLDSATCCSDKLHCCPHATVCDLEKGKCNPGNQANSLPLQKLRTSSYFKFITPASKVANIITVSDQQCPDKETRCGDDETCCSISSSRYACCPLESATCCSDQLHCCPHATVCDLEKMRCKPAGNHTKSLLLEKVKAVVAPRVAVSVSLSAVECPDQSQCPNNSTCCLSIPSGYGCCPLDSATCCSDKLHCCPHATVCDLEKMKCNPGNREDFLALRKVKSPRLSKVATILTESNQLCPDKETKCGDDETCCSISSTGYGCCPLESATCCSDQLHCCPHATVCDLEEMKCTPGNHTESLPLQKVKAAGNVKITVHRVATFVPLPAVECPDQSQCPDNYTCCQMPTSRYGCCPLDSATCCSDKIHCCPHATVCDLEQGKCNPGNHVESRLFQKVKASSNFNIVKKEPRVAASPSLSDVECPDKSQCPDNYTCCQTLSSRYGCCPMDSATCCSDKLHCCPHATVCDIEKRKCNPKNHSLPLRKIKTSKVATILTVSNQLCPDKETRCGDNQTCCSISSTGYACCQWKLATCCSDKLHCCPHATVCDLEKMICTSGNHVDLLSPQKLSPPMASEGATTATALDQQCPDEETTCNDTETCCKISSSKYGCCPLESATCCSDNVHCCPHGFVCDFSMMKCTHGNLVDFIPLQKRIPKCNIRRRIP